MAITIIHNPNCTKSRATLERVQGRGEDVQVREYLLKPLDVSELKQVLSQLHLPARTMIRTGEAVFAEHYASMDLENEEEVLAAIAKHPILLERPIVVRGGKAAIGRPPENIEKLWS